MSTTAYLEQMAKTSFIITIVIAVILIGASFLIRFLKGYFHPEVYNFKKDMKTAKQKPQIKKVGNDIEHIDIGTTNNKKLIIPTNLNHFLVCGTTGSGKTVALSNFIKSAIAYNYPLVIIDGKGDTDTGSLLEITREFSHDRKLYIIDLNNPTQSDKYNPFKNADVDCAKDMLINLTEWSEPHYKFNMERYLQLLIQMLKLESEILTFDTIISNMPTLNFMKLSKDLCNKKLISKEQHVFYCSIAENSKSIVEGATARFAVLKESSIGKIFDDNGIDIYTAIKENASIIFILNPLLYPELSALFGKLFVIDSKKAVSKLYTEKKKRVFYIFDEFNVYVSKSVVDLVNKSRSANVTSILSMQSLSDIRDISEELTEQIIENCNNYLVLRQNSSKNAEAWAHILGTHQTMKATYQVNGKDFVTATGIGTLRRTHEFIYHPDTIKNLKTGQGIFLSKDLSYHTKININKPF